MPKILLTLFLTTSGLIFIIFGCKGNEATAHAILGSWEAIKGDYEEIVFDKDQAEQRFTAYLYGKLFASGTWSLSGGDLIIQLETGEKEVFKDITIKDGLLHTADGKYQYQRIKTATAQIEEIVKEIKALPELSFTDEGKDEFNWNLEGLPSFSITGNKLKADIILTTDDYTDIHNRASQINYFLITHGFSPSDYNTTEIANGFEKGAIKVLVTTASPLNYDPDTGESVSIKGQKASLKIFIGKAD